MVTTPLDDLSDIDFSGMPKDQIEQIKRESIRINPYRKERKGKPSAKEILDSNVVDKSKTLDDVLENGFSFREFQHFVLYSESGLFENMRGFRESMPLLPQVLSPLMGNTMAMLGFVSYTLSESSVEDPVTLLSLGAGRGFLDHDMINFMRERDFGKTGKKFADRLENFLSAQIIVSDIGQYALKEAQLELQSVLKENPNVSIVKLDAMNFTLQRRPYGLAYANELVDNLPTEPLVAIHEKNHIIKVIAYEKGSLPPGIYSDSVKIVGKASVLSMDKKSLQWYAFMPIFVPVEADNEVYGHTKGLQCIKRINDDKFGGIYPLSMGIEGVFKSLRRSFEHGSLILIDYDSRAQGMHNWNIAVNNLRHLRLGKDDVDFQVDPEYISEIGAKHGLRCVNSQPLLDLLKDSSRNLVGKPEILFRWAQANNIGGNVNSIFDAFEWSYKGGFNAAAGYKVMMFQF